MYFPRPDENRLNRLFEEIEYFWLNYTLEFQVNNFDCYTSQNMPVWWNW